MTEHFVKEEAPMPVSKKRATANAAPRVLKQPKAAPKAAAKNPTKAYQKKWCAAPYLQYDVKLTFAARKLVNEQWGPGPLIKGVQSTTEDIVRFLCADMFVVKGIVGVDDQKGYMLTNRETGAVLCLRPRGE